MKRLVLMIMLGVVVGCLLGFSGSVLGADPAPPPDPMADELRRTDRHFEGLLGEPPGPGVDRPGGMGRPGKELGLSAQQIPQIRKLRAESKNEIAALRQKAHTLSEQRKSLVQSGGQLDTAKLATIDEDLVKARADLMRAEFKMHRDTLALLTPEQRKRLSESRGDRQGPGGARQSPPRRPMERFQER